MKFAIDLADISGMFYRPTAQRLPDRLRSCPSSGDDGLSINLRRGPSAGSPLNFGGFT